MTQLFLSYSPVEVACAEQIRAALGTAHYLIWQLPSGITPDMSLYPRAIEDGLRGSAAVIVVWSAQAAQDAWVERQLLFAQRLRKLVAVVALDATTLPITLIDAPIVMVGEDGCAEAAQQLVLHLPPADSDDVLIALLDQLTHDYIRERRAGIERAAELVQRPEYREDVLAILENIAETDQIEIIRALAQATIAAHTGADAPPGQANPESRHIFGAHCSKGHVSSFDKRRVCPANGTVVRNLIERAGAELDELFLRCKICGEALTVSVDCGGYR